MSDIKEQLKSYFEPFVRGLFGKPTMRRDQQLPPVQPRPLGQMMRDLRAVDDLAWGRYAFSRDPLVRLFTEEQKNTLTEKANACGREYARRVAAEYGTRDPLELAARMGMKVSRPDTPKDGMRVLFAEFKVPNKIFLYMDAVNKANASMERPGVRRAVTPELDIERLLLAHELFHFVEEKYKIEIFTRTEKVDLPSLPFLRNRSTIACLGEIAAMAFARELNNLPYSPYLMDVLLTYGYNADTAIRLYEEQMAFAGIPLPEPEEEAYTAPPSIYDT